MTRYQFELPITFEGGSGVTRSMGRDKAVFVTDAPLTVGQRLTGTLRSIPGPGGTATTLHYRACVTVVRPSAEPGLLEVEARFDDLSFATLALHDVSTRRLPKQSSNLDSEVPRQSSRQLDKSFVTAPGRRLSVAQSRSHHSGQVLLG